jgi:hypothetical protein
MKYFQVVKQWVMNWRMRSWQNTQISEDRTQHYQLWKVLDSTRGIFNLPERRRKKNKSRKRQAPGRTERRIKRGPAEIYSLPHHHLLVGICFFHYQFFIIAVVSLSDTD